MKSLMTKKLNRVLTLVLTFMALMAGQTAWAASKTVTYTFTATHPDYNVNRRTLTFTPSNSGFGYSTGTKTATIENTSSTTGFTVNLDDGLQLTYKQDEGKLTFWGSDSFYLNHSSNGGNSKLTLTSSHYYVTHVKIAGPSGSALTGTASPWTAANAQLDTDVDMTTQYGGPADYRSFSATFPSDPQVFGQLTVTYGDPREYAITFNDAVNGQNGVTNTNPTSYNVTTNDFQITAPSRTGYTLSGTTYTDSQHPSATAVNLSQSPLRISRGEAATRKAITFNTTWTAHHYTIHYDANGGQGSMDDQAFTYDAAQSLTANTFTREDYVFEGWNTEADGSGTSYADQQATPNVTATNGATATLYAQWRQVAGSCGDNARWSYDDNGTLSITGTGGTDNYNWDESDRPWEQYKDAITTVNIGDGITYIGDDAFYKYTNLATINGGNNLINVGIEAFYKTQWMEAARTSTTVVYLGHVAYCGTGVSGDVTLADGTITIAPDAFSNNHTITSVTIPASVTRIGAHAFYDCDGLPTVNVLAATPPTLGTDAFFLKNSSIICTFNVRSAAYKNVLSWVNLQGKANFQMRVVSTLALPDGVTFSASDGDKVTILDTDYYVEDAEIPLSGCSTDVIDYSSFSVGTRYVVSYNDGEARTDRYIPDANGQANITMPAADAEVSTESYVVSVDNEIAYIDADGTTKTCTDFTVVSSDYEFGDYYGTATLGVDDATERWYVVAGTVNVDKCLSVNGNARLILCDGATLRVNADDSSNDAFHGGFYGLTIYGQAKGTGTLSVTNTGSAIDVYPDITINGGTINATSNGYNGININQGGTLTQNGGTINATGSGSYQAGIYASGYINMNISTVNIFGGTLNATGTDGAFGIYTESNVTLGWTNPTDRITASSYYTEYGGAIMVKSGQVLYDGTTAYDSTLDNDQIAALAGKTLEPYDAIPFYIDGTAILLDDDTDQPDGYKNVDRLEAFKEDHNSLDIMLYGRTLYRDGDWNTLCLPFSISREEIEDDYHINPLHGATIMYFDKQSLYDAEGHIKYSYADGLHRSGEVENGSLHLYFYSDYVISTGEPYIVKWDKPADYDTNPAAYDIVNPVFQEVTIYNTKLYPSITDEGPGNVTFRGTYSPINYESDNHSILFLGMNNTLYWPKEGAHIGAFRAYFELGNGITVGEEASQVRSFNLGFGEGSDETGIDSMHNSECLMLNEADAWYSLDGRKLDGKPNAKGMYIHNGKKVVIK